MSVIEGRPTVITEVTVRKLEQALQDGLSVSEACFVSGIGRTTYYEHKANDMDFANKMELAKQWVTIKAKKTVVHAIDGGNITAARWWLEHKARNEFGLHPVDEDSEWGKQTEANAQNDKLLQILESMGAIAKEARQETASPQHTTLKAIATELTALEPDEIAITDIVATTGVKPLEPVIVQTSTSPDDVLADLYDED